MDPLYLIRFDDICPTMNWAVWRQVEDTLSILGVKPILAVVPDNQDATLKVSEPNIRFWDEVRAWQARGWTIGIHGYQHRYVTHDAGLVGIKSASEFSGLSRAEQLWKIRCAVGIFENEHVTPEVWVAPSHSFDRTTLDALGAVGIHYVSDGFFLYPHTDPCGMTWIPQQLWRFRRMPFGLWTVCLHLNRWTAKDVDGFKSDLLKFTKLLTDFRSTIEAYANRSRSATDMLFSTSYRVAFRASRWARSIHWQGT